ncbi:extracellular solute-binding protein [Paenibacillus sp. IB182496]|uniref:Extracellular solute-binding protein n=1 Tax=Paenibacillus sabuli TaxID=2772509 RepID=A0A927GST3_9BACL|nr:extracellular solute-binding protein [Paenibacillus sabuli]MBD2847094.1 extracellular solute-binding protein [Paenibacillus sabuli]
MYHNKKHGWKWAALLLLLMSAALYGCSGEGNSPSAQGEGAVTSGSGDSGQADSAEEEAPIEVTWGIHFAAAGVVSDTPVQQELEERYNIQIKPVKITDASIASGEIPDVFTLGDPKDVAAYQAQGLLMPIEPSMLEEKLPEYYRDLQAVDAQLTGPATFDDQLWAVPMFVTKRNYDFAMLWRKDWLDQVGIAKVPETLEEFEAAVYAFTREDPDGNGRDDTYGLTGTMTTTWSSGFYSIFGAYGIEPTMWHARDGEIVNGSVMPEAKEALALLRQWYADKVIDPEFITDTQDNYRTKLYNGRIGVIEETVSRLYSDSAPTTAEMLALNPDAELAPGVNPTGPGGHGSWSWGSKSNYIVFGKQLQEEPEKLARILTIMRDQSTDEALHRLASSGYEGEQWQYIEGDSGPIEYLPGYEKAEGRYQMGAGLFAFGSIQEIAMRERMMNPQMVEAIDAYSSGDQWTDALYFSALPSGGQYNEDLTLLMQRTYAEIITGQKELDAFDAFVEEWYAKGGSVLTEEANALYAELQLGA